ncbi:hypothetical protein AB5J62_35615 [Amycolatopsis sp. cg5]|uniref:WXG100-like domain-containing protein n=1 Tax=Amycolatopsis sp. cg5 TaxID=3238802 RepID=UPI00352651A5
MPEGNPLVAQAQSQTTGVTGIGILESANDLALGVKDGSWVEGGLGAVGVGLEALSLVVDPIGTLAQYGVSWLIEHVKPLKDCLDWLAGNPPVIQSFSDTWANVAREVTAIAGDLSNEAKGGTAGWAGAAGEAYRAEVAEQVDAVAGAASLCDGISTGVMVMGQVVAAVRETVRDLIATLVGKLITWALEEACTLGFATPLVAAQATAAITSTISKVSQVIRKLVKTISNVGPKVRKIVDKLGEIIEKLSKLAKKLGKRADGTSPSAARKAGKSDVDAPKEHTSPSSTHDGGSTSSSGADGHTTPESHGPSDQALHRQPTDGEKPQPWPPERRDPRFEYWESGKLKLSEANFRLIQEKYGIQLHPQARARVDKSLRGAFGQTDPIRNGSDVRIAPGAFVNEEQLARTIYHENVHAEQFAQNGGRRPGSVAEKERWEDDAYAREREWWDNHPINRQQGQGS